MKSEIQNRNYSTLLKSLGAPDSVPMFCHPLHRHGGPATELGPPVILRNGGTPCLPFFPGTEQRRGRGRLRRGEKADRWLAGGGWAARELRGGESHMWPPTAWPATARGPLATRAGSSAAAMSTTVALQQLDSWEKARSCNRDPVCHQGWPWLISRWVEAAWPLWPQARLRRQWRRTATAGLRWAFPVASARKEIGRWGGCGGMLSLACDQAISREWWHGHELSSAIHGERERGAKNGKESGGGRAKMSTERPGAARCPWRARKRQGTRQVSGRAASMAKTRGAWSPRSRTGAARWGISPSAWQVLLWVGWDADLGHFRADLGLGPKIKFALLLKLYNFD
jgi:hypothetical protein